MNSNTDKQQVVEEIHKPAKIKFKRRKITIKGLNYFFQWDLVTMKEYVRENKGFKHILIVIKCFSKYV